MNTLIVEPTSQQPDLHHELIPLSDGRLGLRRGLQLEQSTPRRSVETLMNLNAKTRRGKEAEHSNRAPAESGATHACGTFAAESLRNSFASLPLCAFALNLTFPRIPDIPRHVLRYLRYLRYLL